MIFLKLSVNHAICFLKKKKFRHFVHKERFNNTSPHASNFAFAPMFVVKAPDNSSQIGGWFGYKNDYRRSVSL